MEVAISIICAIVCVLCTFYVKDERDRHKRDDWWY